MKTHEETLAKYKDLLKLAMAQLQAIEVRDQKKLNQIIELKWSIIRNLSGTKELLRTEPALAGIIKQIQEADRLAEQKLTSKMAQTRSNLLQMNKQTKARSVYAHVARKKHPILGLELDDSTPRYFDIQS